MNGNNSCSIFDVPESKRLIDNFVTSCSPFTIILNSLVLYLAFNYVKLKNHLEQMYVISMTAADLIFGLVYMSTVKVNMDIPWFFCRPFYITLWTCSIASVMFLLLLNVHKLIMLFFPLHSFICLSERKVLVQVVCCWVGVFFCSLMFSLQQTPLNPDCHQCTVHIDPKLYSIMVICFYVVPLMASLALSIMIFGFAQKRSSRPSKRNNSSQQNDKKKMLKRVFFVFTSTIWTSITFLPYRVTYLKIKFCEITTTSVDHQECFSENLQLLQYWFSFLLTFGTVINPLITIVTQKTYRKGVSDIWIKVFFRFKKEQNTNYRYTRKPLLTTGNSELPNSTDITDKAVDEETH